MSEGREEYIVIEYCKYCKHWILKGAIRCAHCGADQRKWRRRLRLILAGLGTLAAVVTAVAMIASVWLSRSSIENTLNMSKKQLEQSEKLYELQNRPILSIEDVGWYPRKTLADIALEIKMRISNYGKVPTTDARIIKDIVLRIKTDTLTKFPHFIEDITKSSEKPDVNKDKRIGDYVQYRKKLFNDISEYILKKKGNVTGNDIREHFSAEYERQGYSFIGYQDLETRDFLIMFPGDVKSWRTGRSVSVPNFEKAILEDGGDILLFYYAIEYTGFLKTKKYVSHYIGYYDSSMRKAKQKDRDGGYLFTYKKSFLD